MTNGGQITGEIQNPDEMPRKTFVVKTRDGAEITLERSQVKQVVKQRPAETEYEALRARTADTVQGQWELAEWCRQRSMLSQRRTHLQRIVELEPDHKAARSALGYVWKDGQWTTHEEVMKSRGLQSFRGRWLTPEEIEIAKEKDSREQTESEWVKKVEQWRGWLVTDRARQARESILAIDDPAAVKALAQAIKASRTSADTRALCIKALAKIGSSDAKVILAACALEDPDEDVRYASLEFLKKEKDPKVVAVFVSKLKNKDKLVINRAGAALKEVGDASAVGPLIDALVTTHKHKVPIGNSNQYNAGVTTGPGMGGGSLSFGGPKYQLIQERSHNRAVLDALAALTGVNYGFDLNAWKSWYAAQRKREAVDARRD